MPLRVGAKSLNGALSSSARRVCRCAADFTPARPMAHSAPCVCPLCGCVCAAPAKKIKAATPSVTPGAAAAAGGASSQLILSADTAILIHRALHDGTSANIVGPLAGLLGEGEVAEISKTSFGSKRVVFGEGTPSNCLLEMHVRPLRIPRSAL
jgi:hypothetical protein